MRNHDILCFENDFFYFTFCLFMSFLNNQRDASFEAFLLKRLSPVEVVLHQRSDDLPRRLRR